jgi:hypothetical protein
MHKLDIFKNDDGTMSQKDKVAFRQMWDSLNPGDHEFMVKEKHKRTPKKYKYYFDCVMHCMLAQVGHRFQIGDRTAQTTEEIHTVMKFIYNPITVYCISTGDVYKIPGTTTSMTDSEFIDRYEQQIIADYSGPPFFVSFPTFEQYCEMQKAGTWREQKDTIYSKKVE